MSVVHNLRLRYDSGAIYVGISARIFILAAYLPMAHARANISLQMYSSLFPVAIDPYRDLPLYADAIVHQCREKRRDEYSPHIFAVAEHAWVGMGDEREN